MRNNNNKKLNMIREFYNSLRLELYGCEQACDEWVIRAANDIGYECYWTKTTFTIVDGKNSFSIRFKNGIECDELFARIKNKMKK